MKLVYSRLDKSSSDATAHRLKLSVTRQSTQELVVMTEGGGDLLCIIRKIFTTFGWIVKSNPFVIDFEILLYSLQRKVHFIIMRDS